MAERAEGRLGDDEISALDRPLKDRSRMTLRRQAPALPRGRAAGKV